MHRHLFCILFFSVFFLKGPAQGLFEESISTTGDNSNGPAWLNGYIRSSLYLDQPEAGKPGVQSMYGQAGIIMDYYTGGMGKAYAELRIRAGREFARELFEADLREAYVEAYLGPFTLSAGKQIQTQGKTSFLNPSDQRSPVDPLFRSPDPHDLQLGTWLAKAAIDISGFSTLEVLWQPAYTPSRLLIDLYEYPEYVSISQPATPSPALSEGNLGVQYDLHVPAFDAAVSFYHGYRNQPGIALSDAAFDPVTFEPLEIILRQSPYRINHAGMNVAIPAGLLIFRVEAGFMDPVGNSGNQPHIPLSELSYCAEMEYGRGTATLIAGYHGKFIPDYSIPEYETSGLTGEFPDIAANLPAGAVPDRAMLNGYTAGQVRTFNRLFNYQVEELYHAGYLVGTIDLFNEKLTLELPVMYNFTAGETTLRPSLACRVTDGLELSAGLFFLTGKENTLYELAGPIVNAVYLSFKSSF